MAVAAVGRQFSDGTCFFAGDSAKQLRLQEAMKNDNDLNKLGSWPYAMLYGEVRLGIA